MHKYYKDAMLKPLPVVQALVAQQQLAAAGYALLG